MKGLHAIYRRELAGLFVGPLAWVLLFLALGLNGFLFVYYLKNYAGDVDLALRVELGGSVFWALAALFPPLLTMRMLSEEAKSGLLEYLLTAPVTDLALVLGKFLAALSFMALLWSVAFLHAGAAALAGAPIEWGVLLSSWVSAVLVSCLFCASGILASSLTSIPLLAAFAAVLFHLVIVLAPTLSGLSDSPYVHSAVARIDVLAHQGDAFLLGVFDSAHALFFLAWSALFLFLAVRAVEARRWR